MFLRGLEVEVVKLDILVTDILFSSFEFGNLQNTCNENRPCKKESCHRMRQLTAYVENTAVHIVMGGGSSSTENRDLNVCFPFFLINTRFLWIIEFEWKIENKALFSPRLAAPSSPHILCTRGWIIGDARRFCVLCPVSSWFGIDTSSHDGTEPACWIDAHIGESWLHARHSRICSSILWKQWDVCC